MSGEGVGCRPALISVVSTVLAAGVLFASGLGLVVDDACVGACSRLGLWLYAAGAPVSGLFAALAGGLPVAWPVDLILWVVAGVAAAGWVERRGRPIWQAPAGLIGVTLVYGLAVSLLLERV